VYQVWDANVFGNGRFDLRELGEASGLPYSSVRMIVSRNPDCLLNEYERHGRGIAVTVPVHCLKRAALIGAITKIGVGPTQAAKMTLDFALEVEMKHKGMPANIEPLVPRSQWKTFIDKLPNDGSRWGNDWEWDVYSLFMNGRNHSEIRSTYSGDMLMEIIDQTYVFMSFIRRDNPISIFGGPSKEAVFKMDGWERGGDFQITPISECGASIGEAEAEAQRWQHIRENFTTSTTVNVSLAIRDAFERARLLKAAK